MPQGVDEAIRDALFAQIGVLSEGLELRAFEFKEYGNAPVDGEGNPLPHIVVHLMRNRNQRIFLSGSDPHFRQGFLQVDLYTPIRMDSRSVDALAGQIKSYFTADLALYSNGVKVRIQKDPDIIGDVIGKPYLRTIISIPYESFS